MPEMNVGGVSIPYSAAPMSALPYSPFGNLDIRQIAQSIFRAVCCFSHCSFKETIYLLLVVDYIFTLYPCLQKSDARIQIVITLTMTGVVRINYPINLVN